MVNTLYSFETNFLILSCSQKKKDTPQERAIDLYEGQAFRMVRRFLKDHPGIVINIDVLSAKYGLIDALEEVTWEPWEPYDMKMDEERAEHWRLIMDGRIDRDAYEKANSFFYGSALYYSTLPFQVPHSQGMIGQQLHQLKEWLEGLL